MFDWFKTRSYSTGGMVSDMEKISQDMSKVIPPMLSPKKEQHTVCYSVGPTDDNRVSLTVGWSSITMNRAGCKGLIDALSVAMNNLEEDEEDA
jgi:hypothetical protein